MSNLWKTYLRTYVCIYAYYALFALSLLSIFQATLKKKGRAQWPGHKKRERDSENGQSGRNVQFIEAT